MSLEPQEDSEEVVNPIFNRPTEELLEPVSEDNLMTDTEDLYNFGEETLNFVYSVVHDELDRDLYEGEVYAMMEEMNRGTAPARIAKEIGRYH